MILLSPAKINLGLHILRKRDDGFHNISTLMFPLPFTDLLEIIPGTDSKEAYSMTQSGIPVPGRTSENLCHKAWKLFCSKHGIIPVHLHLHKRIPLGAGLGGGSSNAATVLKGLNALKGDPFNPTELEELAARLGSDCSLFIKNKPALAGGRGEILQHTQVKLSGLYLVLLYPGLHVVTAEAYRNIVPDSDRPSLEKLLDLPIEKWSAKVLNDFEPTVFSRYPEIGELKTELYKAGAVYASMSGSGSSVYGLFRSAPPTTAIQSKYLIWQGYL